ncbi:MAG: hypothetical protein ACI4GZ_00075 [Ruminococcus sp.]
MSKTAAYNIKTGVLMFFGGIGAGIVCRLSDFYPYESLWSFSSIATLFGFWIASITVITYLSKSHIGAFLSTFLYMFGMTVSFYGMKYILGLFIPQFDNEGQFQTTLFILYSVLSVVCGIGSCVLYFWNRRNLFGSVLLALPVCAMLAEGIACLYVLINKQMLLAQTVFDLLIALIFGIVFWKKATNKVAYTVTLVTAAALVFFLFYRPYMMAF